MNHKKIFWLGALTAALVVGCGAPTSTPIPTPPPVVRILVASPTPSAPPTATPVPVVVTDSAGRKVTLAGVPQRLVSLAPSNTEILFALDLGRQVVGVDAFSDFPAEAKTLTQVGGSGNKFNFEQIVALKPDLILAASTTTPEAIKKLEDLKLPVVVIGTASTTFDGVVTPDYTFPHEFMDNLDIPGECTLTLRVRLDDRPFPDGTPGAGLGGWMFHCHIFFHHHQGMVSELIVLRPAITITNTAPPGLVYAVGTLVTITTEVLAGILNPG